jgi:hypothetical protein
MIDSDGYFTQTLDLAMVPISKNDSVLGILVLDVGGEHFLLPRHVVCASAINNPACAPGCINLQGNLSLDFRYPTLVGSYKVSHKRLWNLMQVLSLLHLGPIGGLPLPKVLKNTTNYFLSAYY